MSPCASHRSGNTIAISERRSNDEQIHELVDRHRLEPLLVFAEFEDLRGSAPRKTRQQVAPEFFFENWNAFLTTTAVADRILDDDLLGLRSIFEKHLNGVGDRAL